MGKYLRKRNYLLVGGSFVVLLFKYLTDPNLGSAILQDSLSPATSIVLVWLGELATPVIAVWFAYIASSALFDRIDVGALYTKAKESAIGSAIIFLGICLVVFGLLGLFGPSARAQDVRTYIPPRAELVIPILQAEQRRLWEDHPKVIYSLV